MMRDQRLMYLKLFVYQKHAMMINTCTCYDDFSANTGITSGNMDQFKTRVILSSDGTNTW